MKEVLVLVGSPRKKGNSDIMADTFIQGAEMRGHLATKIYVTDFKVAGCLGCDKCWVDGTHCVQKDEMSNIYPALEKSSVLVFSTPLYCFSWPAQIKSVIDRIYTYVSPNRKASLGIKESVLLAVAATGNATDFDGLLYSYNLNNKYHNWKDCGTLLATGVNEKGAVCAENWLERARIMGMEI